MQTYAIFRRNLCTPEEIAQVDARSTAELDKRADQVRKIRSYVLQEPDGRIGTICIYQAIGPEAIYEHGRAAGLTVNEVVPIGTIDVRRPDPQPAT